MFKFFKNIFVCNRENKFGPNSKIAPINDRPKPTPAPPKPRRGTAPPPPKTCNHCCCCK